jgi:hypothetical protein
VNLHDSDAVPSRFPQASPARSLQASHQVQADRRARINAADGTQENKNAE